MWLGVNNTWFNVGSGAGQPANGLYPTVSGFDMDAYDYAPTIALYYITSTGVKANFGSYSFAHTPPSGFKPLMSRNLPEPSILQPSVGFNVITYTGDNTTPRSITGGGCAPDFVWLKNRTGAWGHNLQDTVRGDNKTLFSDATTTEQTSHTRGYISSLDTDGFTLTRGGTDAHYVNYNAENYVAWCFKKGAEYGFDIQSYVGTGSAQTVSHNLGEVPELIIVKSRDTAAHWYVYHHHALNATDPETDYGLLAGTNTWTDLSTIWNDTAPTSSQFSVGSHADVVKLNDNFIAYLWRSIPGFSKVFSFEGNGAANGPYVFCGFRPRYILWKNVDAATNWNLYDTERDTYNGANTKYLAANLSAAETATGVFLDYFSNGFKIKTAMASSQTVVGIAIAEQPGKFSNAR
jgi:hypothetical protein